MKMNLYFSLCENKAEMRFPPWEKDIGSLRSAEILINQSDEGIDENDQLLVLKK
jgi:hypothetical protein